MTALDWGLLLIVGLSALLGMLRGLIGVAVSLAAWLLAGIAAYVFGGEVGRSLGDGEMGWLSYLGGYALIFVAVWIGVGLFGMVVRRIAHSAGLSEMDRLMGLGLGAVRGVFFACALLVVLGMTTLPREPAWRGSMVAAMLMPGAELMRAALPDGMARKVDLEGRGTSLQATVQAEAKNLEDKLPKLSGGLPGGLSDMMPSGGGMDSLPQAVPEGLSGALPDGLAKGLPDVLPEAVRDMLPQKGQQGAQSGATATQIKGDPAKVGADRGQDDKRVH
ncbi:CvpA family protein [Lysobacter sp. CA196]|uniref:CvpA family protein n=1 Tax=Lysobacter sp. CA196 TaxID=3455606 RepID=UPI003F8D55E3